MAETFIFSRNPILVCEATTGGRKKPLLGPEKEENFDQVYACLGSPLSVGKRRVN